MVLAAPARKKSGGKKGRVRDTHSAFLSGMGRKAKWLRLALLTAYAIAMGYVEAMVVVYLRRLLPPEELKRLATDYDALVRTLWSRRIMWEEQTREAATLVMLVAVSLLAGKTRRQKFAFFLWAFALWDIFYYVFLRIWLGWPCGLRDLDVLFLIPCPWVAEVWVPLLISCLMLGVSFWLLKGERDETSG